MTDTTGRQRQSSLRVAEGMMHMTVRQYFDEHCDSRVKEIETRIEKELSERRKACEEMKTECNRQTDELIQKLEEMIASEEAAMKAFEK